MAVTGELWICDLIPEFLTNALVFLSPLQATGAVATGTLQTITNHLHDFLIFIQSDCHFGHTPFCFNYSIHVNPRKSHLVLDKANCLC